MRAKKIDTNQNELVKKMRAIGMSVFVTSMVGDGFVDVVAGYRGVNYLFEIKDGTKPPSKRKLTPDEERFFAAWKGKVHKIESFDDILSVINSRLVSNDDGQ